MAACRPFFQFSPPQNPYYSSLLPCTNNHTVEPHGLKGFEDGQRELAKDLIVREQQIELLISSLPGLENTTQEQQEWIRKLEEELLAEEERRKKAVDKKEELLEKLEEVIRSIRRP